MVPVSVYGGTAAVCRLGMLTVTLGILVMNVNSKLPYLVKLMHYVLHPIEYSEYLNIIIAYMHM